MLKLDSAATRDMSISNNEYSDYKEIYSYSAEISKLYAACKELLLVVRSRKPLVNFKVSTK